MAQKYKTHTLKTKKHNHKKELQFEIDYQQSLTLKQRFEMMFKKSNLIKEMLIKHGHRKPFEVIKRKIKL
jgi:hypothetical protein